MLALSTAFQPIVDVKRRTVHAYEALVRGPNGEGAAWVFAQPDCRRVSFDSQCRRMAMQEACRLGISTSLNLNSTPPSILADGLSELLTNTNEARPASLVVEITEQDVITNSELFAHRLDEAREAGIRLAIDDFGSGYSGLNLLADFQPDEVKLDMHLIRAIHASGPRQAIVRAVVQMCTDLGIDVIAEGVETTCEFAWLRGAGIDLFQGYLFAKPAWRRLTLPDFSVLDSLMADSRS